MDAIDGVVITGVYGAGKSSVAAEIAELLERRRRPYGAVDLDWLRWSDVPGITPEQARKVYLDNVDDVTRRYRAAGVRHFVFALVRREQNDLEELRVASGLPLRVVRLTVAART